MLIRYHRHHSPFHRHCCLPEDRRSRHFARFKPVNMMNTLDY